MNQNFEAKKEHEKPEGQYSNYFRVGHNAVEFILDFGQYSPEKETPRLCTRIITCPLYAKELLRTIQESIATYEKNFGSIK